MMTSSAIQKNNQNKNKPKLKFPKDSDEESTESSNKVIFYYFKYKHNIRRWRSRLWRIKIQRPLQRIRTPKMIVS